MRPKPDVERTLRWLGKQVRPSVERCVEAAGVDSVLEALNLPHVVWRDAGDCIGATVKGGELVRNRPQSGSDPARSGRRALARRSDLPGAWARGALAEERKRLGQTTNSDGSRPHAHEIR